MTDTSDDLILLIGLDDTDNLESCGTGFHARTIAKTIEDMGLGACVHITRHQLLFSPLVPFTSHNSAACVRVRTNSVHVPAIETYAKDYLEKNSAEGSDAGLCVVAEKAVPKQVQQFGYLCKRRLMFQAQARELAANSAMRLHGLTGTEDGVIGALAAVGLHSAGCDGRLLWIRGLRDMVDQTVSLADIFSHTGVDVVQTMDGAILTAPDSLIDLGSWARAVLLGGQAVLIVDKGDEDESANWRAAPKQYIKQF